MFGVTEGTNALEFGHSIGLPGFLIVRPYAQA